MSDIPALTRWEHVMPMSRAQALIPTQPGPSSAVRALFQPVCDLLSGARLGQAAVLRASDPEGPLDTSRWFSTGDHTALLHRNVEALTVALRDAALHHGQWLLVKVDAPVGRLAVARLVELAQAAGVDPQDVVVEVRHVRVGVEAGDALATLALALAHGFRTAVSCVQGKDLLEPFLVGADIVKLDPVLLRPEAEDTCHVVVEQSRRLSLPILAFGIETIELATRARQLGVDWGQGWYFGAPEVSSRQIQDRNHMRAYQSL